MEKAQEILTRIVEVYADVFEAIKAVLEGLINALKGSAEDSAATTD